MSCNELASLKAGYTRHLQNEEEDFLLSSNNQGGRIQPSKELLPQLKSYLKSVLTEAEYQGICWHETNEYENIAFPKTEDRPHLTGYGNLCRINDIRRINKYFELVNVHMEAGQYLIVSLETKDSRKERILNKFPPGINRIYYTLDFVLKRVMPKWKPTRKLYFSITKGRNRVLTQTEAKGRLVSCGFEIVSVKKLQYNTWIVAEKVTDPTYDMQPTYGALIRLKRVGKEGKIIDVLKLRTMHPYSEYLQEYVYFKYQLEEGGKFNNDFRNTSYGKWMRKYWVDELPMFINFFRGDLKLVGVRPLSIHYFELYPRELQDLRIQVKPGLVPPYYADLPSGLEEIQESEKRYLEAYLEHPWRTDIRYFFKSVYNILFKRARSS